MKHGIHARITLPLLIIVCQINAVWSQSGNSSQPQFFDAKYRLVKNSLVHGDSGAYRIQENYPVRIVKTNGDSVFIAIRPGLPEKSASDGLFVKVDNAPESLYFLISDGEDKMRFSDFDFSPLVIPLKIRPALPDNPVQFTGDVSIGPYFGYQSGSRMFGASGEGTQTAWTICAFGSPTMININPANQNNNADDSNSLLGISAGFGVLFDINNLQFGLIAGWDWISGTASESWIYQGKTWTSFSFAYNLTNQ